MCSCVCVCVCVYVYKKERGRECVCVVSCTLAVAHLAWRSASLVCRACPSFEGSLPNQLPLDAETELHPYSLLKPETSFPYRLS